MQEVKVLQHFAQDDLAPSRRQVLQRLFELLIEAINLGAAADWHDTTLSWLISLIKFGCTWAALQVTSLALCFGVGADDRSQLGLVFDLLPTHAVAAYATSRSLVSEEPVSLSAGSAIATLNDLSQGWFASDARARGRSCSASSSWAHWSPRVWPRNLFILES